jgi:CoA:oxalate CoA-transferase
VANRRILEDIRVLDFTQLAAGAYCPRILADMGAEVLKVEQPPNGDDGRHFMSMGHGQSALFFYTSSGKKSFCIDLKSEKGRSIIQALLPKVDIVLENFAPGVIERLGLSYENIKGVNPRIIMCSVSAFGRTGPLSGWRGTDGTAQAMSGLAYMTGEAEGPPLLVTTGIADPVSAVQACLAVGYALFHRERTGEGQYIDISMLDSVLAVDAVHVPAVAARHGDFQPTRLGAHHYIDVPDGLYKARDGYIFVEAWGDGPDSLWARLARAMERPDLVTDERFATDEARYQNLNEVIKIIETWLAMFPSDEDAVNVLQQSGVIASRVLSPWEAINHPQVAAREMMVELDYPFFGPQPTVATPYKFSATPVGTTRAPFLGEHNAYVLQTYLGLHQDDVDELTAEGVIYEASEVAELRTQV